MTLKRPVKYRAAEIPIGSKVQFKDADPVVRVLTLCRYEAVINAVRGKHVHATVTQVWDRDGGGQLISADEVGTEIVINDANVSAFRTHCDLEVAAQGNPGASEFAAH